MGIQQQRRRRRQIPAPRRQCCFSFAAYARSLMDHLRRCGIRVEPGLSEVELGHLESHLGLVFPPDLRAILSEGLPAGSSFPDWRHDSAPSLRAKIQHPMAELCGLVRRNRFWWQPWGNRPGSGDDAAAVAAAELARVAALVPVYGNCYIPSSGSAGNPVLLVQSGEVTVVGNDLADFFEREVFHGEEEEEEEEGEEENGPNSFTGDDDSSSSLCLIAGKRTGRPSTDGSGDKERFLSSLWMKGLDLSAAFRRKKGSRSVAGTRSAEASPRPSVSSTASSGGAGGGGSGAAAEPPRRSLDVVSRRKNNHPSKGVALEALLGFTMAAPAWVAKKPRHIDFWSDLCGQRLQLEDPQPAGSMVPGKTIQILPPLAKSTATADAQPPDLRPSPQPRQPSPVLPAAARLSGSSAHPGAVPGNSNDTADAPRLDFSTRSASPIVSTVDPSPPALARRSKSPRLIQSEQSWLHGYLDDMAGRLRIAGWKEDEICEMMVPCSTSSRPNSSNGAGHLPRQAVMQGLVFKVHELSDSLKKSGWSVQDVAEAFSATAAAAKALPIAAR